MPTSFNSFNDGDYIQDEDIEQYAAPINNLENGKANWAVGGSGTDDYTATVTPTPPTLNAGAAGYWVHFKPDVSNTGACTINLNGAGAQSIKLRSGADPGDNALLANGVYVLVWDGTNFQVY